MTAPLIARTILRRLARPRSLAGWSVAVVVGLGVWLLTNLWWGEDVDAVGLTLVSSGLVLGLTGSLSFLLAADVVRLTLAAGSTRRHLLAAWALVMPAVVVPVVVVVTGAATLTSSAPARWPGTLVPAALTGATLWFVGLGLVGALAAPRRAVRQSAVVALIVVALGAVLGAGATTVEAAAGWPILLAALALGLLLTGALILRTPVPSDLTGLLVGPAARKAAR